LCVASRTTPQPTVASIYCPLHYKLRITTCLTMIRHMIHSTEWFAVSFNCNQMICLLTDWDSCPSRHVYTCEKCGSRNDVRSILRTSHVRTSCGVWYSCANVLVGLRGHHCLPVTASEEWVRCCASPLHICGLKKGGACLPPHNFILLLFDLSTQLYCGSLAWYNSLTLCSIC
jgi:hypothetical protein